MRDMLSRPFLVAACAAHAAPAREPWGAAFRYARLLLRLQAAVEDAIPRRAVLLGAHRGRFLVADHHFLLGIPLNGAPAEAERHVAEGADDRRPVSHLQSTERLVAALDAIDPIAFVGVEHLVFHRFAARRPAPRAAAFSLAASAAAFSLTAATAAAGPPSCPGLRLDPRHGFRVVIHRTANRMPHESWNLVDRVAVHLGNNLVGTQQQVAFVAHHHG